MTRHKQHKFQIQNRILVYDSGRYRVEHTGLLGYELYIGGRLAGVTRDREIINKLIKGGKK